MVTDHVHPGLVAVTAGIPDAHGRRKFSSGLLIASRLVLTTKHGVAVSGASGQAGPEIQLITGSRGAIQVTKPIPGKLVWLGSGDLDAALIELSEKQDVPGFLPSLIWGEPICTRPLQ